MSNSDNGIPVLALSYICDRCNADWYEKIEIWLK
jgi:hypothetical protein